MPAAVVQFHDPEPFAWIKTAVPGTGSASANPPELATVFDGDVWNLLEGKLDLLNSETAAKKDAFNTDELREAIQEASAGASTQVSDAPAGASSSSAAAASSSPPAVSEPVDTTAWETDAKFQHSLKYLAWMLKKDGSPRPVFKEPETDNPMEVDYSNEDEEPEVPNPVFLEDPDVPKPEFPNID